MCLFLIDVNCCLIIKRAFNMFTLCFIIVLFIIMNVSVMLLKCNNRGLSKELKSSIVIVIVCSIIFV